MTTFQQQGIFFSVVALIVSILSIVFTSLDPQVEIFLAGFLIVFLGVPHGALDPIFAQALPQINGWKSWIVFVSAYLMLAASVVALWWYAPIIFLICFLTLAVLHFAGDLAEGANFYVRFFYGGAMIVLPSALHAAELERLFSLLTDYESAALVVAVLTFVVWPWVICLAAVIVFSVRRDAFIALEVLAVSILTVTASPLLAFTIFFCCMHSLRHILRTQIYADLTLQRLAVTSVLPMFGVLLIAATGWYFLPASPIDERVIQFVFVALAGLTVPHMILVERVRFSGWPLSS